jgi:hypothetical protein
MREPLSDEQAMLLMINNTILPLIDKMPLTTDLNRFYYRQNHEQLQHSLLNYQEILRQKVENLRDYIADN